MLMLPLKIMLDVYNVSASGTSRGVVTSTLVKFPLNRLPVFKNLKFALYGKLLLTTKIFYSQLQLPDVPGIDDKNFHGDEIALLMHGLMPTDVDFKVSSFPSLPNITSNF